MGFVVGKPGKAPDGSRVAIELTGPLARTIRVLAGGRADTGAGGVALGGDREVAARIVEHLNYVI